MTKADKITSIRLILAPFFFVIYFLPHWFPSLKDTSAWTVPCLWALFIVSEISDMLDGIVARKLNEGSDFGRLFDPFADTLVQASYFLCFVVDGILPAALFLVVLYREFGILFIRNLMLKKGIAMGARMGGKIKTVTYIITGIAALASSSLGRLGYDALVPSFRIAALVIFSISVVFSVLSFFDYVKVYKKAGG
ncbi:MAG: CDP-diacylglycerol--glycerol-3-phosphate 3-phosphatidyltransferase [Treponema sp.]|jgi:CDP-diacylglycerol--glycerol-3-phosphate 3-phosphatidyltransferase|nr:CDP-diacylglycerol--glycerol-3-phosphate 3-phosphatidyltransferase [Treponema sp.]